MHFLRGGSSVVTFTTVMNRVTNVMNRVTNVMNRVTSLSTACVDAGECDDKTM